MQRYYSANVISVSLILLTTILIGIFLGKDQLLGYQKQSQYMYQHYLSDKFQLIESLEKSRKDECKNRKTETIIEQFQGVQYRFNCVRKSFFIQPKPTKEKYIQVNDFKEWIDIDYYQNEIVEIRSLDELPESSEKNPKIVRTLNDIDDALLKNFYGVIITEHYFDIRGKYKIYGTVFSRYDNQREERNLTYKRSVIDAIENQFSRWEYIPRTQNILTYEKTF